MSEALEMTSVPFGEDSIQATIDNDKVVWGVVAQICKNIGLSEKQKDRQVMNIKNDIVLKDGCENLPLIYESQVRNVLCIKNDYIPLWLAKISITPTMKRENPDAVDKLVRYQLKAKDVLADYFLHRNKTFTPNADPTVPISREELATFLMMQAQATKTNNEFLVEQGRIIQTCVGQMDSMMKTMKAFIDNAESSHTIIEKLVEDRNDLMKMIAEKANDYSNQSVEEIVGEQFNESEFLRQAFEIVGKIGAATHRPDAHVLNRIYTKIRHETNLDDKVIAYRVKYKTANAAIIKVVASDNHLRELFNKFATEILNETEKIVEEKCTVVNDLDQLKAHQQMVKEALALPSCVRELADKLMPHYGLNIQSVINKVYKKLEFESGVNLKTYTQKFAEANNLKYVRTGYAISKDSKMFEMLEKVINDMYEKVVVA